MQLFRDLILRCGITNLSDLSEEKFERRVKKLDIHPKLELQPNTAYYDVAVIQMVNMNNLGQGKNKAITYEQS